MRVASRITGLAAVGACLAVAIWIVLAAEQRKASPTANAPAASSRPPAAPRTPAYTHLVWADEFNGRAGSPPSASHWVSATGPWGQANHELQLDTASPANAALDGHGDLVITARRQRASDIHGVPFAYTSARLETSGRFSTTHGLIEARMQLPAGRGVWSAFWLLGDDSTATGWPGNGEIDILEAKGQQPRTAYATLHGPGSAGPWALEQVDVSPTPLTAGFHTYAISWAPGSITWLLDGVPYVRFTKADLRAGQRWTFDGTPFHLVLNLSVGGNFVGPPAVGALPARLVVDWVRVYR